MCAGEAWWWESLLRGSCLGQAEQRRQREVARNEAENLEAATGAILDRLDQDELRALIDAVDSLQGGTGLFRKLVSRQGLESPLVRPLLLKHLANGPMTK